MPRHITTANTNAAHSMQNYHETNQHAEAPPANNEVIGLADAPAPLSQLATDLQTGQFDQALQRLEAGAPLGVIPDQAKLLNHMFEQINTQFENNSLNLQTANSVLAHLETQYQLLSNNQREVSDQAIFALSDRNEELARFFILHLNQDGLNLHRVSFMNSHVQSAILYGFPETARLCLERGADFHQLSSRNETLIALAAKKNQPELITYLIANNINIEAVDYHGERAIEKAVRKDSVAALEVLLNHGAIVNLATSAGCTLLHLAVDAQNIDSLKLLLQHQADPNFPDEEGYYPIQLAVMQNSPELVRTLIEHNSPLNIIDPDGQSLLELAHVNGATRVIPILLQHEALNIVRSDEQNVHDSLVNHGLCKVYYELLTAVPVECRYEFHDAEQALKNYLTSQGKTNALESLAEIKTEGHIKFNHLNQASEQDILALIYSFIRIPEEARYSLNSPPKYLADVQAMIALESLVDRLSDAWNQEDQSSVCPSGRVNRLLDTFTGLYEENRILTKDLLRREMLDKASVLQQHYENNLAENTSIWSELPATLDRSSSTDVASSTLQTAQEPIAVSLQAHIRENLTHDYVDSGILSQELFDRMINEWIHYIE